MPELSIGRNPPTVYIALHRDSNCSQSGGGTARGGVQFDVFDFNWFHGFDFKLTSIEVEVEML